jgi:hypothetical protein
MPPETMRRMRAEGIIRPIPQCWMVFNVESQRPQGGDHSIARGER